jgi:hypothetical protein
MAGTPPANPGTMTPESKSALGSRLGLETPPDPMAGADVVPGGDLSDADEGEMRDALSAAYDQHDGYQADARDTILMSPEGSSASEGYHLQEQSAAINDQGHLDVGPVPDRPVEERA